MSYSVLTPFLTAFFCSHLFLFDDGDLDDVIAYLKVVRRS
jgi:hypothetical protein